MKLHDLLHCAGVHAGKHVSECVAMRAFEMMSSKYALFHGDLHISRAKTSKNSPFAPVALAAGTVFYLVGRCAKTSRSRS